MATTQELLAAINNIQPDAQAALPVIPNNGNPRGAFNMPPARNATEEAVARPPASQKDFSWLQPSQYMRNVQDMLSQRRTGGNMQQTTMPTMQTGGQAPMQQQLPPVPARQEVPDRPFVMPQRRINEYMP